MPLALADFSLVELKSTNKLPASPHCKKHGAMNKLTPDGIYRCITVSGYEVKIIGSQRSEIHRETICRAGCNFKKHTSWWRSFLNKINRLKIKNSPRR